MVVTSGSFGKTSQQKDKKELHLLVAYLCVYLMILWSIEVKVVKLYVTEAENRGRQTQELSASLFTRIMVKIELIRVLLVVQEILIL
jgi:NADH:ubiquinone oxidoreductase subunit 6 (subunit J)